MLDKEKHGIEYLKNIHKHLHRLLYKEICIDLDDYFPSIPISVIETDKLCRFQETEPRDQSVIFRARENDTYLPNKATLKLPFKTLDEISIITKDSDIQKIKFGRCNKPKEARFYASNYYPTACSEAITSGFTVKQTESKTVTVGAWKITEPLILAQIDHSSKHLKSFFDFDPDRYKKLLSYTENLNQYHKEQISMRKNTNTEVMMQLRECFADEFAKNKIISDYDYMISNYYCDKVFNNTLDHKMRPIEGIIYPSINYSYQEWNIVLHPRALRKIKFLYAMMVWVVYHGQTNGNTQYIPLEQFVYADEKNNLLWKRFGWNQE